MFGGSGLGGSGCDTMLKRCVFFVQVCYRKNDRCFRSDDRTLLLFPSPLVLADLCVHAMYSACQLLLSGDVELNPGPPKPAPTNKTSVDQPHPSISLDNERARVTRSTAAQHSSALSFNTADNAARTDNTTITNMLEELLQGQKQLADDVAAIRLHQENINSRFDSLESRVALLESGQPTGVSQQAELRSEVASLDKTLVKLTEKYDDLENRSRRDNIIIHGLAEYSGGDSSTLMEIVSEFITTKLQIECPPIERCHILGRKREGTRRPVILKMLDFRGKSAIMSNVSKLKGCDLYY